MAAFAREIQLRARDLPEATVSDTEDNAPDESLPRAFAACVGEGTVAEKVATFLAPTFFYREREEAAAFSSEVDAAPTPFEARRLVEQLGSAGGFGCLQSVIPSAIEEAGWEGGAIRDVTVSRLTTPLPPTRYAYGIRLSTTLVAEGRKIPLFVDVIGFAYGPAEVKLAAAGSPTPVNQVVEATLMQTLYSRAVSTRF